MNIFLYVKLIKRQLIFFKKARIDTDGQIFGTGFTFNGVQYVRIDKNRVIRPQNMASVIAVNKALPFQAEKQLGRLVPVPVRKAVAHAAPERKPVVRIFLHFVIGEIHRRPPRFFVTTWVLL